MASKAPTQALTGMDTCSVHQLSNSVPNSNQVLTLRVSQTVNHNNGDPRALASLSTSGK